MPRSRFTCFSIALALAATAVSHADVVTDWNTKTVEVISASRMPGVAMYRAGAIVQVAVFEAVNAITGRYPPSDAGIETSSGSSIQAAVAAATRATLLELVPGQEAAIEVAYQSALKMLPDGPAKTNGVSVGEKAATAVLELRVEDGSAAPDTYRPRTAPGIYVPTTLPAAPHWGKRAPWILAGGDQFRPAPPPTLASDVWARDYNEIKLLGSRNSTHRTTEQTQIARFWASAAPASYFAIARSVADAQAHSEPTQNARLLATVAMAMDDALIAVLDAKYAYALWRPITAIRNGDIDRNDRTERDAGWVPLIDTPMHPEYPCAHCTLAAAVATVLEGVGGDGPMFKLTATSPTAPGFVRTWTSAEDLVQEVAMARIYGGVHYRYSNEVGRA
ncbi:MAG: vanadium-dependent haloperoxidase, partial [Steroidobacteraceae bacterium]